jgi:hypothetical protein
MSARTVPWLIEGLAVGSKTLVLMVANALLGQSLDGLLGVVRTQTTEPLLHGLEHLVLDAATLPITIVGVVECLENPIEDPVRIFVVAPSLCDL